MSDTTDRRVVVTGVGVIASNAHGSEAFVEALRQGVSGVRRDPELERAGFGGHLSAIPQGLEDSKRAYFTPDLLVAMKAQIVPLACIAAIDAWQGAGLERPRYDDDRVDWDSGAIMGTWAGTDLMPVAVPLILGGRVRRMGSTFVEQLMTSAPSARLPGLLALGGQVTTNASGSAAGTEAVALAYHTIRAGRAERMIAGAADAPGAAQWSLLERAGRLQRRFDESPERASRPMSASADGLVPGAGAGALLLESLASATRRGAPILAEVLAGQVGSGGRHAAAGTPLTAEPMARTIARTLADAGLSPSEVDLVNGGFAGEREADATELEAWSLALGGEIAVRPWLQSTKALVGEAFGGGSAIECVATVLQLARGFVHGQPNCEDPAPGFAALRIARETLAAAPAIAVKASHEAGYNHAVVVFRRWGSEAGVRR